MSKRNPRNLHWKINFILFVVLIASIFVNYNSIVSIASSNWLGNLFIGMGLYQVQM